MLTQFSDSTSGIGALGLDGKAFVIQLITFLLAFLVLQRYAFKPIAKMMEQRRKTIEQGVELGERMKKEQALLQQKVADELHKAREQADDIVANAQGQARQTIQEAEEAANIKADGILATAHDRITQDTARARKALEHEMIGLVSEATEAIIDEKVDEHKDAQLIEKALKGHKA
jgi:F-type H+-transporting ATPase subunit b